MSISHNSDTNKKKYLIYGISIVLFVIIIFLTGVFNEYIYIKFNRKNILTGGNLEYIDKIFIIIIVSVIIATISAVILTYYLKQSSLESDKNK